MSGGKPVGWEAAAKKFDQGPVFAFRPAVEQSFSKTILRTCRWKRMLFGGVFFLLGLGALIFSIVVPLCNFPLSSVFVIFTGCFAVPFVLLGLVFLLFGLGFMSGGSRMTIDTRAGGVRIVWGRFRKREATFSIDDVRLTVVLGEDRKTSNRTQLALIRGGNDADRVVLMAARARSAFDTVLPALQEAMGAAEVTDKTLATISLSGGGEMQISREALNSSAANFRTRKLIFPSPDMAAVVLSGGAKAFWGVFFGGGLLFLIIFGAASLAVMREGSWFGGIALIFPVALGGGFAVLGWLGLAGRLGDGKILFDRQRGLVLGRSWKQKDSFGAEGMPLADVVALQICSRYVSGDDDSDAYMAYQLNAVVRADRKLQPSRVNLMCHAKEAALRQDAGELAEFLKVPLLDHA